MGRREDVDSLAARGDEAQRVGVPRGKKAEEKQGRREWNRREWTRLPSKQEESFKRGEPWWGNQKGREMD